MRNPDKSQLESPVSAQPFTLQLRRGASGERGQAWANWVPGAFPGVEITGSAAGIAAGVVRRVDVGQSLLWTIILNSQTMHGEPARVEPLHLLSGVTIQNVGVTEVTQGGNRARAEPGDIYLVDGSRPFDIESIGVSRVTVFLFPHHLGQALFPELLRETARPFPGRLAEVTLLREYLVNLSRLGAASSERAHLRQEMAALQLAASLPVPLGESAPAMSWRIRRALQDIEVLLEDGRLSAQVIARRQKISRRRLDMLFRDSIGSTVAAQILECRLARAASWLVDDSKQRMLITEIAYGVGFNDAAHFTRAFRKRFERSPSEWRRQASG